MVEIIIICLNHVSKDSRSVFARQLNVCFYRVSKVVNQDLNITKIWIKFFPKSLT